MVRGLSLRDMWKSHAERWIVPGTVLLTMLILVAALVPLTRMMINAYGGQVQDETDHIALDFEAAYNVGYVRVKDAVALERSGLDDLIDDKFRSGARKSSYVVDVGLIDPANGTVISSLNRTNRSANGPHLALILDQGEKSNGVVTSYLSDRVSATFPWARPNQAIIVQGYPNDPLARYGYAILDIARLCEDKKGQYFAAHVYRIELTLPGGMVACGEPRNGGAGLGILKPEYTASTELSRTALAKVYAEPLLALRTPIMVFGVGLGLALALVILASAFARKWAKRREVALETSLHETQNSNRVKDEFLANMSHEVRTPLNGLINMVELLARTDLDENQKRYIRNIRDCGSSILALVNDVLDLSKIDQGMLSIDPVPTDLRRLSKDVLNLYAGKAKENRVSLLLDIRRDVPQRLNLDPSRIRQVLGNLVSNAIKFTSDGDVIVAIRRATAAAGHLEITVQDTGIGIEEHQIDALFERFVQAEAGTHRKYGGTGLGLPICREIVTAMGGQISAQRGPDGGSIFRVVMPLEEVVEASFDKSANNLSVILITPSQHLAHMLEKSLSDEGITLITYDTHEAALAAMQAGASQFPSLIGGLIVDEANDVHNCVDFTSRALKIPIYAHKGWAILLADKSAHPLYRQFSAVLNKPFLASDILDSIAFLVHRSKSAKLSEDAAADEAGAPAARRSPSIAPPRPTYAGWNVLFVDDNAVNRLVGEELLGSLGMTVALASSGKQGVEMAEQGDFDAIFMDCRMPEMDGYEATGILKSRMSEGALAPAPIIAVTANAMRGDRERCLAAGMDAFISKPVHEPDLIAVLENVVAPARARRAPARTARSNPPVQVAAAQAIPEAPKPSALPPLASAPPPPPPPPPAAPDASAALPRLAPVPKPEERLPLIDKASLSALWQRPDFARKIVTMYLADGEDYLAQIDMALSDIDSEAAILAAHTIKSSSKIVGAHAVAVVAERLETHLRKTGQIDDTVRKLAQQCRQAMNATKPHLDRPDLAA